MEIQQIKSRLTIHQVLSHYGIKPAKDSHIRCPFHEDDKPSMKIYADTGTYHCFGCGKTGDVIQFIQDKEEITKHQAILKAKSMIPAAQVETPRPNKTSMKNPEHPDYEALFKKFKHSLLRSTKAQEYLKERGLENIKNVGYNSGKFYNKLKHCLIFPLKDKSGNIVSLYGRRITESNGYNAEYGKHYYTENRTGLYPSYPPKDTETLIITEAVIDAATLLQIMGTDKAPPCLNGKTAILSAYGTSGLTKEHKAAIKALENLKEVVFFFDGDTSGEEGAEKYASELAGKDGQPSVSIVPTPENEDVNSLYLKYDKQAILQLINERKPIDPAGNLFPSSDSYRNEKQVQTHGSRNPSGHGLASQPLDISNPHKIIYETGTARYIVKGSLPRQLDKMLVSLDVQHLDPDSYRGALKYRCRLDLYEEKQTRKEAREAGEKLDLRSDLIEADLSVLCDLLEEHREATLNQSHWEQTDPMPDLPTQAKCKNFLSKPDLITRINELIEKSGITGEYTNRLFLFVLATSYKMPETLHALIQGSSGSGKTHLLGKIADLMPQERVERFTRITDNSLYNYGEYDLQHRLLCLEDVDGLKEEALFAWRELISNNMLRSSTSQKDDNGNSRGAKRIVRGPMASMCATTHGHIYEDNMSRLFIIAVDESPGQTARIIEHQSKLAAGVIDREKEQAAKAFLQDCVRMLWPYKTVNPYADKIKLPEQAHKIRRLHELFLCFVKQITLINQYQRKKDQQGRLITEKEDLQTAATIMFESIFLKVDELDGSLRQFFENLKGYIASKPTPEKYEFIQREVRHALNTSKTGLQRYLNELVELEYISQSGGYQNRGYKYKILWWDDIVKVREGIKQYLKEQIDKL